MTWRAWRSGANGCVRTSILTASTTPAPHPARRVTPQNRWSQRSHKDFAETLGCSPFAGCQLLRPCLWEYVLHSHHEARPIHCGRIGACLLRGNALNHSEQVLRAGVRDRAVLAKREHELRVLRYESGELSADGGLVSCLMV